MSDDDTKVPKELLPYLKMISDDLKEVKDRVTKLDEVVRTGNGKESLVTKVAVLESRQDNDEASRKRDMKMWGGIVTTLCGVITAAVSAGAGHLAQ